MKQEKHSLTNILQTVNKDFFLNWLLAHIVHNILLIMYH